MPMKNEITKITNVRAVGDHQRPRRRPVDRRDRRRLQPLGSVLRDPLLKERRPSGALREALHEDRPATHRPQQRLADPQVVLDEVTLRLAALLEQQLAGT